MPGALPAFSLGFAVFYFCTWFQHVFDEGSRVPLAGGQNGGALCFVCPGGCPPASYVVVKRRRVSPLFPAALLHALVAAPAELGARPPSGSPASPDEKELPHLGAGPERPGPLEKKKRKDPHTGSLPFSYSQREQRMGSASCAEPRRRRGEVLSSPAHHRLSLWRKERAPGRSSAPQNGQYVMTGILL